MIRPYNEYMWVIVIAVIHTFSGVNITFFTHQCLSMCVWSLTITVSVVRRRGRSLSCWPDTHSHEDRPCSKILLGLCSGTECGVRKMSLFDILILQLLILPESWAPGKCRDGAQHPAYRWQCSRTFMIWPGSAGVTTTLLIIKEIF